MKNPIILIAFFLLNFAGAMGGGYQINLHSPKSSAMGLAGTSLNLDASSIFFNPGAMTSLPGSFQFATGLHGIRSTTKFQLEQPSVYQAITDNPIGLPFFVYASAKLSERVVAGVAINTPFGSKLIWEDGWAGRFLIQELTLQTLNFQPSVSVKVLNNLSAGLGVSLVYGKAELLRKLPVQDESFEGEARISGSTTALGINAGLFWVPLPDLRLGMSYRSRTDMQLDAAEVLFNVPSSVASNFPSPNKVNTSLPLPANLDLGMAWGAAERWMLVLNFNYVFWNAYKNLQLNFASNSPVLPDESSPREYSNTLIVRVGTQYQWQENIVLRAGGFYDPSPVNRNYFSPETPSLNSIGITTGLSFLPLEGLSVDMAFVFIMGVQEEVRYTPGNFNGIYKSRSYIPGLGISYHF